MLTLACFDIRGLGEGWSPLKHYPYHRSDWFIIFVSITLQNMEQIGKILIVTGIILFVAGLLLYFAGNKLNWLGHLPGDINIVKENVRIIIPVTSMILLSVVLSLLLYLIRKLF